MAEHRNIAEAERLLKALSFRSNLGRIGLAAIELALRKPPTFDEMARMIPEKEEGNDPLAELARLIGRADPVRPEPFRRPSSSRSLLDRIFRR